MWDLQKILDISAVIYFSAIAALYFGLLPLLRMSLFGSLYIIVELFNQVFMMHIVLDFHLNS